MSLTDLVILIPSHSLEDFPTELEEGEAAGLLNAFAVAWHPRLLEATGVIPNWQRADEPSDPMAGQLYFVPTASNDWLSHGWADRARDAGSFVLTQVSERQEMIDAALAVLDPDGPSTEVDPDLVADFLALGTCYLQMELLTRHMHHFGSLDEVFLQREAVMAAESALAGDAETTRAHLKSCFESLHEARERFYPVDCYLLDLCLLVPEVADEHLRNLLLGEKPVNLLLNGVDAETIASEHPDLAGLIREAWARGVIDIVGGDHSEVPVPLVPLDSLLWDLDRGRNTLKRLFGRMPTTWARRRFGLAPLLPQLLSRSGYHSALHFLLDDGLYPDAEQSKVRWEGCDGTVLDAMSRIPLAAEGATGYLRFAMRMAESMEDDQAAALMLARWPETQSPWFEDLVRMHGYAPCLGRFVTLDDYFQHTDTPGRLSSYNAGEYLAPFLTQSVAGRDPDPVSRYHEHFSRRAIFDSAAWCDSLSRLLAGQPGSTDRHREIESLVERAGCEGPREDRDQADARLEQFRDEAVTALETVITGNQGDRPGLLVLNSLSFPRTTAIPLPPETIIVEGTPDLRGVQQTRRGREAVVDLTAAGFTWFPVTAGPADPADAATPLAEGNLLRNEFFEIHVNATTGGIERIKGYGRKPNVLSQQLAFRFPRERTVTDSNGDQARENTTWYSEMVCHGIEVTSRGPHIGEIQSHGELIDQLTGQRVARFLQSLRTVRYRPSVDVEIKFDVDQAPDGDPWSNYLCSRFAFGDMTAAITRSVLGAAQPAGDDRFESPHFVEIANESSRVTITGPGLPFYRKTRSSTDPGSAKRMIDAILVPEGEQQRRFHFRISVDQPYPMQDALDLLVPPLVRPDVAGPPSSGSRGWFFHVDARNVQITRVLDLINPPAYGVREADGLAEETADISGTDRPDEPEWAEYDQPSLPDGFGFAVRLQETEGRHRSATLRCWRTPSVARQRDLQGRTLADLPIEGDGVRIDLTAHEVADIELRFE
ncbi:MAG: hypothetical protein QF363_02655 [Planctomycetaceae bacterium]|nr:hypothetical protein [Planctomycetaceae bacterium]